MTSCVGHATGGAEAVLTVGLSATRSELFFMQLANKHLHAILISEQSGNDHCYFRPVQAMMCRTQAAAASPLL